MKRITKKVRQAAADGCAIMATLRANYDFTVDVEQVLSKDVGKLAWNAFMLGPASLSLAEAWAEAEAKLREGWMPGDATA